MEYIPKKKSDVSACLIEWVAMVERESRHKVKVIRSDNGGEYVNKKPKTFN